MIDNQHLRDALAKSGKTQADLARAIGVSPQAISKMVSGNTAETPKLHLIARFLEVAPDYLTGETDDPFANAPLAAPPRADMVQVAMLDLAYGMGETFLEDHPDVRQEEFPLAFIRHFTKSRVTDLMIAEGVGDSMAPTIGPNDLVLIDRAAVNLNIDDRIWACAIGQMGMIKRLRGSGDGVTILSDNPNVPDNHAADGELHIIGRVVGTFGRL
ncbi:XRE family transcriptional regulator [Qipengyuania sp. SM2507]